MYNSAVKKETVEWDEEHSLPPSTASYIPSPAVHPDHGTVYAVTVKILVCSTPVSSDCAAITDRQLRRSYQHSETTTSVDSQPVFV